MLPKALIMWTNVRWKPPFALLLAILWSISLAGQKDTLSFWDTPEYLHKGRFWTAVGGGIVIYTGAVVGLNELWYKETERTSFHFFNDIEEWQQMDKAGHMFTTYFEADYTYHIARWSGMKRNPSIWTGALVAMGLQTTLEVLDGFSSDWGFSWYDMAFNLAGASFWAGQQAMWDDQRIRMKMSTTHRNYPEDPIAGVPGGTYTIQQRAHDIFGENILQSFLKDYNAQTIWLSVNIHSFMKPDSRFPKWLNVAAGYGAENMFGGFDNVWGVEGNTFQTSDAEYPRYRQLVFSPDIDFTKIKVKSKALKTVFGVLNIFKFPAPALVLNRKGGVKWDWLYY